MGRFKDRGIKVSGGPGMLVHQAVFAFKKWFGLAPDAGKMYEAACKQLNCIP